MFCFCNKKKRHKRKKLKWADFFKERDHLEVINRKKEWER